MSLNYLLYMAGFFFKEPLSSEELANDVRWDEVADLGHSHRLVKDAVARYQEFYLGELKVDGELGAVTKFHLERPRCGCPDRASDQASSPRWPEGCWEFATNHRLGGELRPLDSDTIHELWLEAIAGWSAVCGLRMSFTKDRNNAKIYADPGRTSSGVLAWSYLPNGRCRNQLEQRYSTGVTLSRDGWLEVIYHELGHAIGLHHMPGTIMNSSALGRFTAPDKKSIKEVQDRYGPPQEEPDDPGPDPPGDGQMHGWISVGGETFAVTGRQVT